MRRVTVQADPPVAVAVDTLDGGHRTADRRHESAAARALLRRLLAAVEPAAVHAELGFRPSGQPHLPDRPDLAVSLSHDGGHVAAAVGRCAHVGVDVQAPADTVDPGMLRRCLHEHARAVAPLDDAARATALARVWTVQEACVKATGAGIGGRPWLIDVPPTAERGRWGDLRWAALPELWSVPVAVAWSATV